MESIDIERMKLDRQRAQIALNVSDCQYRIQKLAMDEMDLALRMAEITDERNRHQENIAASKGALADLDKQIETMTKGITHG